MAILSESLYDFGRQSTSPTFQNAPVQQYENLGVSLDSGTFTVHGADGTDLSASNPAVVVMPSKSNPGQFVRINITANQSFNDASSASGSDIVGNLFGTTSTSSGGDNITVDMPFFIYAVLNDSEDAVAFALSRTPHMKISRGTTDLGKPGTSNAETQNGMFFFENVTLTDYDNNPCFSLGSVRMRMASDDWTVQTLVITDGISNFQEDIFFTIPLGQFGCNSGTYTSEFSGGTAAVFSSNTGIYSIRQNGSIFQNIICNGDGGVDGSGTANSWFVSTFITGYSNACLLRRNNGNFRTANAVGQSPGFAVYEDNLRQGAVQWADFGNGDRRVDVKVNSKINIVSEP